jgi:predicted lipid-binding transport protein (Tim44 family)
MPISDRDEPEAPQAGADLIEFLDQRRQRQAQQGRQRVLVGVTVALSMVTVMLALSNVMLLKRIAFPPAPRIVAPAPATPLSAPGTPATPPPAPPRSAQGPPANPAPGPRQPAAPADAPAPSPGDASPPPQPMNLPMPSTTPAEEADPARRTARWLVQTYGRLDAETRAARVAEFYSGEERAFWRRVLAGVQSEPTR